MDNVLSSFLFEAYVLKTETNKKNSAVQGDFFFA
jgi:hypothetical protein